MPRLGRSRIDILEGGLVTILKRRPAATEGKGNSKSRRNGSKLAIRIPEESGAEYLIEAHGYFVTMRCIVTVKHIEGLVDVKNRKQALSEDHRLIYRQHCIKANIISYYKSSESDCAIIGLDTDIPCNPLFLGIGCGEDERAKYIAYSSNWLGPGDMPESQPWLSLDELHRAGFDVNGQIGSARSQDRRAPTMTFYSFQNNPITDVLGTSGAPVLSEDGYCLGHVQSRMRPSEKAEDEMNDSSTQRGIQYLCPAEYVVRLSSGVLPHLYRRAAYSGPLHRLRSLTTLLLGKRELNILILCQSSLSPADKNLLNNIGTELEANLQNYDCKVAVQEKLPDVIADIVLIPAMKSQQQFIEGWIRRHADEPKYRFAVIMQVDIDGSGPGLIYPNQHQPFDISPSSLLRHASTQTDENTFIQQMMEVAFRLQWYIVNGLSLAR